MSKLLLALAAGSAVFLWIAFVPPLRERSPEPIESSSHPGVDHHFSLSYVAARVRFRARALRAGATQQSYVIAHDDYTDTDLTMDTAFFQGSEPTKLLVHLSGTHGVEGFAGSAIQAKILDGMQEAGGKVQGPSLLFVHAVNPFGFHNRRRFNEDNIDLNRNWLLTQEEWDAVMARGKNQFGYEDLAGLLNPPPMRWYGWYTTMVWNLLRHAFHLGKARVAIVTGQYHNMRGVYFGGNMRARSTTTLWSILTSDTFVDVGTVVTIDVHSGLGASGEDSLMVDDGELATKAHGLLGDCEDAKRVTFPEAGGASEGYDAMVGGINVPRAFPQADGLHITQEFGTLAGFRVAWALIFENAAFWGVPRSSYTYEFAAQKLQDAFYVNTLEWKTSVLRRGVTLFDRVRDRM
jgi:hypothetical protein